MEYTKKEILERLNNFEKLEDIYIDDMINYKGKTKDTKEKYTEIIAKEILNNSDKFNFNNIKTITRTTSYNVGTHDGKYDENSNRREEIIAMKMLNSTFAELGKIIDYQIPLKDKRDTKAGKIDLISYDKTKNVLYLIELKKDESDETLLRCILEIMTYIIQVDKEKLKRDYNLDDSTQILPAILIFEDTRPYKDMDDEYAKKLIDKFNISLFTAKIDETFYIEKKQA